MSRKVKLAKNNIPVGPESLSGEVSATPMTAEALRLPPTFCKGATDLPLSLGLSLKPMSLLEKAACLSHGQTPPCWLWVDRQQEAWRQPCQAMNHGGPVMIRSLYLYSCGHPHTSLWFSQRFVETGLLTFWSHEKTEVYV